MNDISQITNNLEYIRGKIQATSIGDDFELNKLLSERWVEFVPTTFGKQFKAAYEAGLFPNIEPVGTIKGNNHNW